MYIHTVVAYVYVLLFYACDLLQNCKAQDPANEFTDEVKMWVYEEDVHGQPLTQLINEVHENVLYLPGISLPENLVATPDLLSAVADADILVFCLPHQFVRGICKTLKGHVRDQLF